MDFASAIASIESGGRYDLLGPSTRGDRAYGKYQVMGANIAPWAKEILGQEMSPQDFLANPQAQDAVFQGKFGQYLDKHGSPQDAASMWFTGKPYAQGAGKKDILGTTGESYVAKFMRALGPPDSGPPTGGAPVSPESPPSQQAPTAAPMPGPPLDLSALAAGPQFAGMAQPRGGDDFDALMKALGPVSGPQQQTQMPFIPPPMPRRIDFSRLRAAIPARPSAGLSRSWG